MRRNQYHMCRACGAILEFGPYDEPIKVARDHGLDCHSADEFADLVFVDLGRDPLTGVDQ